MDKQRRDAKLLIRDDLNFLPTVQTFIENTTLTFGLGQSEALALTLAGEEIFNYLCTCVKPEAEIEISCSDGSYYAELDFTLPLQDFALKAFNLTASINVDDETSLEEMGLIIATRMVDKLEISRNRPGWLSLSLYKEKSYPENPVAEHSATLPVSENFSVISPDAEELKFFVNLCAQSLKPELLPLDFSYPGKVVDMVKSGNLNAAIVKDEKGRIGGGITWFRNSAKMVECNGPYILAEVANQTNPKPARQNMAAALLEYCLNAIAKSPAVGLINRQPGPDLPKSYFEPLGSIIDYQNSAVPQEIPAWFRQMQEDPGTVIWSHPEIADVLRNKCQQLALPREIRLTSASGENETNFSVLASQFERAHNRVTLRPLWAGEDMKKNISDHLELFATEMIENIFFVIDLGQSWQAKFAPALKENSFTPRLILPYGGDRGDLLILQKMAASV